MSSHESKSQIIFFALFISRFNLNARFEIAAHTFDSQICYFKQFYQGRT